MMFEIKNDDNLMGFLIFEEEVEKQSPINRLSRIKKALLGGCTIVVIMSFYLVSILDYRQLYILEQDGIDSSIYPVMRSSTIFCWVLITAMATITVIVTAALYCSRKEYTSFFSEIGVCVQAEIFVLVCMFMMMGASDVKPYIPLTFTNYSICILIWMLAAMIGAVCSTLILRRQINGGYFINGGAQKHIKRMKHVIIPMIFAILIGMKISDACEIHGTQYMLMLICAIGMPYFVVKLLLRWHYAKKFGHTHLFTNEEYEKRNEVRLKKASKTSERDG